MIKVDAFQIAETINVKKLKAEFTARAFASSSSELFYEMEPGKYLHVFHYGVIVFVGYTDLEKSDLLKFLKGYADGMVSHDFNDDFFIKIDESITQAIISNDFITLNKLEANAIRIVTLNMAQSVAFDFYESLTYDSLTKTKAYVDQLEQYGKVKISKRNLLKFIGKTRNVKNSIVDNLYILDDPSSVWDDIYLEKMNKSLKELFDVHNRFRDLDYKLRIVEENLDLFTDILQHSESSRLEWIIIILILIEIINLFIEKLF